MSSETPFVSIVTAVLNGRGKIERSIESVAKQEYRGIEYIVIDGGSTDGTQEFLKRNHGVAISWVSEPDHGISNAFNKGIEMAGGELIGILNAGDWYEPRAISIVAETARNHPDTDVICGSINLWEDASRPLRCYSRPDLLDLETSVYHPAVFVKKSAYEKTGGYDESFLYAMDYELLLRMKREGRQFVALPDILANMKLEGISSRYWYEGLREVKRARGKYFPSLNTSYYHGRAVIMNVVAKGLNAVGLSAFYRAYRAHNDRRSGMGR